MKKYRMPIDIVRAAYNDKPGSYSFPIHTHKTYQWYLVLSGEVEAVIDGERFVKRAGDSMIVKPGSTILRKSANRRPVKYLCIDFANKTLSLDSYCNQVLHIGDELADDMHALAGELQFPGTPNPNALTIALIVRIIVGLCREVGRQDLTGEDFKRDTVKRVEDYMRRNMHNPIKRDDIADVVNLSGQHVSRLFKAETGKTLNERLTELRIEYSKEVLLKSDIPVTSVALDVGFSSFSHFAKIFKTHVGMTPSEYRKAGR